MSDEQIKIDVPSLRRENGIWTVRLVKYFRNMGDKLTMDNERASLRLTKLLKRYKDPDPRNWESWYDGEGPLSYKGSHDLPFTADRHESELLRQAFIEDLKVQNIDVNAEEASTDRGPYRQASKRDVYDEAARPMKRPRYLDSVPEGEWVLRGGQEVLARHVDSQPKDWQWTTLPKVTYFSREDLVDYPRGSSFMQNNYVFRQGDTLYGIRPEQLFKDPMKKENLVRLFVAESLRTGSSSSD